MTDADIGNTTKGDLGEIDGIDLVLEDRLENRSRTAKIAIVG
jgi:hypothetical protein